MRRALGPVSFSMWDEPGLLVDGFDLPPKVLMGHALPYYERLITGQGYQKAQDLIAYEMAIGPALAKGLERAMSRVKEKPDFQVRPIRSDRKHLDAEIALILDILNDAWHDNWGYVPMTQAEVDEIASMFRVFLRPDAIVIAEYQGEAVGFSMMLPNVNEALAGLGGRLLPFGVLKMLWRLKVRGVRSERMAMMGVRRKWWDSPVGATAALLSIYGAKINGMARGAERAELSWILDSNERIKNLIAHFGAKIIKRYRIYEKTIA